MNSANFNITAGILVLAGVLITGCNNDEGRNRVEYTHADGKKTTDVTSIGDGTATYQVFGRGTVPPKAEQLHQEARAKGQSGDYISALALLRQASEIAPDWVYPRYDMAFTYLLQGDVTNALLKYREVDRLEPKGFFTTKTALWTLDREVKGTFPKGTYLAFVSLEWAEPEKRRVIVERMTTSIPAFAPAWKEKALLTEEADHRLAALDMALSLEPDPETYGICALNKATLLNNSGKAIEAKQIAEELARSDSSTLGTKALAKELLKTLSQETAEPAHGPKRR